MVHVHCERELLELYDVDLVGVLCLDEEEEVLLAGVPSLDEEEEVLVVGVPCWDEEEEVLAVIVPFSVLYSSVEL